MCYDSRVQKNEIRRWLKKGIEIGATHCLVLSDCWDNEDFPVYVMPGQNIRKMIESYTPKDSQPERLMEVYNLQLDIESQLDENRAMNY